MGLGPWQGRCAALARWPAAAARSRRRPPACRPTGCRRARRPAAGVRGRHGGREVFAARVRPRPVPARQDRLSAPLARRWHGGPPR
eukprot:6890246-Pyramimonas_sp.AAC.1